MIELFFSFTCPFYQCRQLIQVNLPTFVIVSDHKTEFTQKFPPFLSFTVLQFIYPENGIFRHGYQWIRKLGERGEQILTVVNFLWWVCLCYSPELRQAISWGGPLSRSYLMQQTIKSFQHWKRQGTNLSAISTFKAPPNFLSSVALIGDRSRQTLPKSEFSQLRRVTRELNGTGEMASARVFRKPGTIRERSGTLLSFSKWEPLVSPRVRKNRSHLWLLGESTLPVLCLEALPNISIAPKWYLHILKGRYPVQLLLWSGDRAIELEEGGKVFCCIQITLIWSWSCLGRKH